MLLHSFKQPLIIPLASRKKNCVQQMFSYGWQGVRYIHGHTMRYGGGFHIQHLPLLAVSRDDLSDRVCTMYMCT